MKLRYLLAIALLYTACRWLVLHIDMRPEHAAALALAFAGVGLGLLVAWIRTARFTKVQT